MAFSSSLSRERASLTKQARIYSDREQARIYVRSENEQGGGFSEGESEGGVVNRREEEVKRIKATDKPRLLNVSILVKCHQIISILDHLLAGPAGEHGDGADPDLHHGGGCQLGGHQCRQHRGQDRCHQDGDNYNDQVVSVVGRRTTGRSQSAERILDEERAFTRAELVTFIIISMFRMMSMVMGMVIVVSAEGTLNNMLCNRKWKF